MPRGERQLNSIHQRHCLTYALIVVHIGQTNDSGVVHLYHVFPSIMPRMSDCAIFKTEWTSPPSPESDVKNFPFSLTHLSCSPTLSPTLLCATQPTMPSFTQSSQPKTLTPSGGITELLTSLVTVNASHCFRCQWDC